MGQCRSLRHVDAYRLGRCVATLAGLNPSLGSEQAADGNLLAEVFAAYVRLQTRMCFVGSGRLGEKVLDQRMHCPFSRVRLSPRHTSPRDSTCIPVLDGCRSTISEPSHFRALHPRRGMDRSADHSCVRNALRR